LEKKAGNSFMQESSRKLSQLRAKHIPKLFNIDNIIRVNQKGQAAGIELVSPADVKRMMETDSNVKLLDVRSPLEFSEVHIDGSINIPIDILSFKLNELGKAGEKYIVLCRAGTRSPMAADMLMHKLNAIYDTWNN
jgi:rhodanese-related sulfurtransferase